jgi:epoxyqueuosine reductase
LLGDESAIVRGAAVWALSRLVSRQHLATLAATRGAQEIDPTVQEEWTQALTDNPA